MDLRRRSLLRLLAACALPCSVLCQALAPRVKLTSAELRAIENCLAILRACQLSDGSFNMVNDGQDLGSPVWVAPYFVQHAAIALLAANDHAANPADVARVGKWLQWCVAHQEKDGFWCDFTGTIAKHPSNGKVDAHDSSAAMFLLAAERYQRSGQKLAPDIVAAAKRSLQCIDQLTDADGLTWAKSDYKIKYLMDNLEVCAGLKAAQAIFAASGDSDQATTASRLATSSRHALRVYYGAVEKDLFAVALHPSGALDGGLDQIYPHGLAQLFGVSFLDPKPIPFARTCQAFQPQTTRDGVGAERFLIAATSLGDPNEANWRARVVKDAATFKPQSVYLFRPALVVLALLEGAGWMRLE